MLVRNNSPKISPFLLAIYIRFSFIKICRYFPSLIYIHINMYLLDNDHNFNYNGSVNIMAYIIKLQILCIIVMCIVITCILNFAIHVRTYVCMSEIILASQIWEGIVCIGSDDWVCWEPNCSCLIISMLGTPGSLGHS